MWLRLLLAFTLIPVAELWLLLRIGAALGGVPTLGLVLITGIVGASLALIAATAIAVLAGGTLSRFVDEKFLSYGAGALFIAIGLWTIVRA